jgi:FkbM family methyltransferase
MSYCGISGLPTWVININAIHDSRLGVKIRHIESGNDGDVCNSIVTHELLNTGKPAYCLDIGVDEGWWSFFVVDTNPLVTINAFEPNPLSYDALLQHLADVPQIKIHNYAISDAVGFLNFECLGGQSHSRGSATSIKVPCVSICDYIKDAVVDCIKIDTEGHDLVILKTLHPYLHNIRSIIFEFTVYWNGDDKDTCISRSRDELYHLHGVYKYMYMLSRRGLPQLTLIEKAEDIDGFVNMLYNKTLQVDILVTNTLIQTIPIHYAKYS